MRCRGEVEIVYECTKYIECNVLDMATPLSAGKTQSPGPVTYVFARLESEHLVSESMHWSTTSITSISTFFVFPEEQHNMSARRRGEEMTRQELCLTYLAKTDQLSNGLDHSSIQLSAMTPRKRSRIGSNQVEIVSDLAILCLF